MVLLKDHISDERGERRKLDKLSPIFVSSYFPVGDRISPLNSAGQLLRTSKTLWRNNGVRSKKSLFGATADK